MHHFAQQSYARPAGIFVALHICTLALVRARLLNLDAKFAYMNFQWFKRNDCDRTTFTLACI